MKEKECWYVCDVCDTDSPVANNFGYAKILARNIGWTIGHAHFCPTHKGSKPDLDAKEYLKVHQS